MKFLLIYVPNLRFSFEEDWCTSTIGENFRLSSGLTPSTKEKAYFNNGIIPWINSGELKNKYISFTENKLTLDAVKKHNLTIYPMDTMVIAIYGLEAAGVRGKASITKMDSTISQSCMAFNSLGNVLTQFMYYVYKKEAQILGTRYAQGTKQQNLSSDLLSSYKLLYPSKEEQLKIVNFLSLIDEKIETQSKIIDDLLTVKNGISNKLFKLQQIELSNHYLFEYLIEGDKTAVDTSCYKKITVKLNNQGLAFSELNREMADTRPFYVRHKGELIIGKQNYFNGSIAIVTEQFDNCICSNAIMSFKIKGIYSDFLYYQISNNNYLNSQSYKANGTGQKELSEKEFLNFKIWCPQLEVQQKIVNCFKSLDLKIENEKAILNSYFQEKSYLLNNMFI